MNCPNCGAEMAERPGLTKVWYCSVECGYCIEDINLEGAAHRLAREDAADRKESRHGGPTRARS